jgi:hypothetical protein
MSLPLLLGVPSLIWLDAEPYLAEPLPLWGLACVLRCAADAIGRDIDAGENIEFSEEAVQGWLGGDGAFLVVYLALHPDRPALTLLEAKQATDKAKEDDRKHEIRTIIRAAFRNGKPKEGDNGSKIDIAKVTWGKTFARFYQEGLMPAELGRLTLSQIDNLITEGVSGDAVIKQKSDALKADMHKQWLEQQRKRAAEAAGQSVPGAIPTGEPAVTTLADLGLSIKPGQEMPPGFEGLEGVVG